MSNPYDGPTLPSPTGPPSVSEALSEPIPESDSGPESTAEDTLQEVNQEPAEPPAVVRFKSCRWYEAPDAGSSYCSNRDVLPFAGKNGFAPEAWCPDCALYKMKRTVKKRSPDEYSNY